MNGYAIQLKNIINDAQQIQQGSQQSQQNRKKLVKLLDDIWLSTSNKNKKQTLLQKKQRITNILDTKQKIEQELNEYNIQYERYLKRLMSLKQTFKKEYGDDRTLDQLLQNIDLTFNPKNIKSNQKQQSILNKQLPDIRNVIRNKQLPERRNSIRNKLVFPRQSSLPNVSLPRVITNRRQLRKSLD